MSTQKVIPLHATRAGGADACDVHRQGMSRRDTLKWFGILAASPALASTASASHHFDGPASEAGHWPSLKLQPITAPGYGKDPNQMQPSTPWPKTLTPAQLSLVGVLCDLIVPREGEMPSATEVKVPAVFDEWVSAPYEAQQADRSTTLHFLVWIDDEARLRFNKAFTDVNPQQQTAILDDIAFLNAKVPGAFRRPATAFRRMKNIVLAAYFCSPAGWKDIGYMGSVPIAGDYPGPTPEAKAHLDQVLKSLGLS